MGTGDESETETEPGVVPKLNLVEAPTGGPEGIESRVMLARARARLLGRGETTPVRVGRYVVVERLGAGAMGVVLRAYDPKLRREVALKIVRPRGSIAGDEAQARLLREAQALARLAHPNVVSVYDAEITDDGVCIAMEYVEGLTLRAWLRERSWTWPEVLAKIIAVARGLAAAHAAGLVHRDVKPDNCLVGTDGRVRVTDFGLARATVGGPSSMGDSGQGIVGDDDDDAPLTRDGTVLGTPAYMAPEQHEGSTADPSTDQYALGVLMWEALYGERPFRGPELDAFAEAKHSGAPARPPKRGPAWLHPIIVRALAVEPEQRWPSVAALADALESGKTSVGRRRATLAVAGLGLAMVGATGWQQIDRHRTRAACRESGTTIRGAWTDDVRAGVQGGLSVANPSHGATTHAKLVDWIDPYVAGWERSWAEACMAAEVDGSLTPELYTRAQQCLGDRRDRLVTLLEVLAEGEGPGVQRAVSIAAELPMLEPCTDPVRLGRARDLDPEGVDLRRELHRARALAAVERYEDALAIAQKVETEAADIGVESLELEAVVLAGVMAGRMDRHEDAEAPLRRALVEAGAVGLDEVAADAALALVDTVGRGLGRHAAALAHADTATLLVDRVEPEGRGPRQVRLLDLRAMVHVAAGEHDEAERLQARALELLEAQRGPDHPSVAVHLEKLAAVHRARGSREEAQRLATRAMAIRERTLGTAPPFVHQATREGGPLD